MRTLKVLVADDEPAARRYLCDLLEAAPGVEVAARCADGEDAAARLRRGSVDVAFLDVRMPGLDGFQVIESLSPAARPAVVFVTAYDDFALQAFAVEAWDYLLKPFDAERLGETLERLRRRLEGPTRTASPGRDPERRFPERLAVPCGKGRIALTLAEVSWIGAEANYARFHLGQRSYLARISLTALEEKLDPRRFVRVHRSARVNVEGIERLEPRGHGDLTLVLTGGERLNLSRRYRERLEVVLESLS